MRRKNHGRFGGIYHSKRWKITRQVVLTRDDRRCTNCGRAGKLEVHHIVPLSQGGAPYDLDNLRSLCRDCHFDMEPSNEAGKDNRKWLRAIDAQA